MGLFVVVVPQRHGADLQRAALHIHDARYTDRPGGVLLVVEHAQAHARAELLRLLDDQGGLAVVAILLEGAIHPGALAQDGLAGFAPHGDVRRDEDAVFHPVGARTYRQGVAGLQETDGLLDGLVVMADHVRMARLGNGHCASGHCVGGRRKDHTDHQRKPDIHGTSNGCLGLPRKG